MSVLLIPLALGIALSQPPAPDSGNTLPPPPPPIALSQVVPSLNHLLASEAVVPLRPVPVPRILYGESGGGNTDPARGSEDPAAGPRPKAIEYSDAYYTRLKIHRYASYATLPLFVAEYFVGQKLIHEGTSASHSLRNSHRLLATGIGVLFGVNTVTGLWNLWDSRKEPAGRARRTIHGLLMLTADAGFVATGMTTPRRREGGVRIISSSRANTHRALAIGSMSLATASYLMMLIWKD